MMKNRVQYGSGFGSDLFSLCVFHLGRIWKDIFQFHCRPDGAHYFLCLYESLWIEFVYESCYANRSNVVSISQPNLLRSRRRSLNSIWAAYFALHFPGHQHHCKKSWVIFGQVLSLNPHIKQTSVKCKYQKALISKWCWNTNSCFHVFQDSCNTVIASSSNNYMKYFLVDTTICIKYSE